MVCPCLACVVAHLDLISSPAALLVASSDWSYTLWMSDIFVAMIMSVGHLSSCPPIFLNRYSSFAGKDFMLFDIRRSSFCVGLSK